MDCRHPPKHGRHQTVSDYMAHISLPEFHTSQRSFLDDPKKNKTKIILGNFSHEKKILNQFLIDSISHIGQGVLPSTLRSYPHGSHHTYVVAEAKIDLGAGGPSPSKAFGEMLTWGFYSQLILSYLPTEIYYSFFLYKITNQSFKIKLF